MLAVAIPWRGNLKVERCMQVHIITASCENMIDGKGMRPGDILQAANGKTVEVWLPVPQTKHGKWTPSQTVTPLSFSHLG